LRTVVEGGGHPLSASAPRVVVMDIKLELVMVPVTDVDRAKDFSRWSLQQLPDYATGSQG
jgi:hypothetical protein